MQCNVMYVLLTCLPDLAEVSPSVLVAVSTLLFVQDCYYEMGRYFVV